MSVVAIDDTVAIVLFGIFVAIANALGNVGSQSILMQVLNPFIDIIVALLIALIFAILLILKTRWFTGRGNPISLVLTFTFLAISLADYCHGSTLLACMMVAAVFATIRSKHPEITELIY